MPVLSLVNTTICKCAVVVNSNTNIRDRRKGAEEEDNMIDRKECEKKAVFQHNLKLSRETNGDKQVTVCGLS